MTLRAKLLALFTLLALGPLLAIGLIGVALSERAVTAQLEEQTQLLATRSAEEIERRVRLVESDLRLLGENAESERLLRLGPGAPAAAREAAMREASEFFDAAWQLLGGSYAALELRDVDGAPVLQRGDAAAAEGFEQRLLEHAMIAAAAEDATTALGSVHALVHLEALLPRDVLDARFGARGTSAVVHRPTGRVLHYAGGSERPVRQAADAGLAHDAVLGGASNGALRIRAAGGARVGWVAPIASPPLAVVALADRAEFAAPFDRQRRAQLGLVLLLAAAVLPAGWFLLGRATHSLRELTAAADRVASGDLDPALPRSGRDEVGRLSDAFRTMTREVRRMVSEIERSRQLAAVGEFAAELAHEIRNPLTGVKLNLQRLERMLERGDAASGTAPLRIALREVARLDRVVRGTLRLGRPHAPAERCHVGLDTIVAAAVEPLREQLAAQQIGLELDVHDAPVLADAQELSAALLNVLLNAVEAMPEGGTLRIAMARPDAGSVDVTVADTGSGIDEAAQARLFRPFSTTKPEGTGLGLALARRAVEAHGGRLTLEETGPAGTRFRFRLPLAAEPTAP